MWNRRKTPSCLLGHSHKCEIGVKHQVAYLDTVINVKSAGSLVGTVLWPRRPYGLKSKNELTLGDYIQCLRRRSQYYWSFLMARGWTILYGHSSEHWTGKRHSSAPKEKLFRLILISFFIVFHRLTVMFRFVVWQRGLPHKFADCVFVLINNVLLNLFMCLDFPGHDHRRGTETSTGDQKQNRTLTGSIRLLATTMVIYAPGFRNSHRITGFT